MQQKSELPEGWIEASLDDISIKITDGTHHSPPNSPEGDFKYITAKNIKNDGINLDNLTFVSSEVHNEIYSRCNPEYGDLLLIKDGATTGIATLNNLTEPFSMLSSVALLKFPDTISNKYIMYYIRSPDFQTNISEKMGGVAITRLTLKKISSMVVALPSLPEQHRIVSAIEALFTRLDVTNKKLDSVLGILKKFRESVLAAACDGRLTEEWRKENKYLSEWKSATLNQIGNWSTGGTPSRKNEEYFGGDVHWIKSGDLNDSIVTNTEEKITKKGLENSSAKLLPAGTVSIALYGATIGKLGILSIDAATNQACANCIPDKTIVDTRFLFYYLLQQRKNLIDAGQGGAQPNLTNQIVREWPIFLPPLPEQQEIVRRVDALFAFADSIEAKVATAREKTEKLRQSILTKAFSGELVETEAEIARKEDRDYETAEVLIEKIKAEKKKIGKRV